MTSGKPCLISFLPWCHFLFQACRWQVNTPSSSVAVRSSALRCTTCCCGVTPPWPPATPGPKTCLSRWVTDWPLTDRRLSAAGSDPAPATPRAGGPGRHPGGGGGPSRDGEGGVAEGRRRGDRLRDQSPSRFSRFTSCAALRREHQPDLWPLPDESKASGKRVVGDVHYASANQRAGFITPVPGGVGPMTVAMLMEVNINNVDPF